MEWRKREVNLSSLRVGDKTPTLGYLTGTATKNTIRASLNTKFENSLWKTLYKYVHSIVSANVKRN